MRILFIALLCITSACSMTTKREDAYNYTDHPEFRAAFRKTMDSHKEDFADCYREALAMKPDMVGKIVFSWTLNEHGKAQKSSIVSNDTGDDWAANCVLQKSANWQFPIPPPSQTGTEVRYPLNLAQ